MDVETGRPVYLDEVLGHETIKQQLKDYFENPPFLKAVMLYGPPGIGKTTIALASARTFGFDPIEINASRSIRSFEDVEAIKDSCRSQFTIQSFMTGDRKIRCVIFDEVDGSDPHAQAKIVNWIKDPTRKVPILCTGNDLPTIFKRSSDHIETIRCMPPKITEMEHIFKGKDITDLVKECQYDIRRMIHRLQYGKSECLPKFIYPPTGLPIEESFALHQKMFDLPEILHEYRGDKLDILRLQKASRKDTVCDNDVHIDESDKHRLKSCPGKLNKLRKAKVVKPK
jgi:hypothetical protein